MMLRDSLVFSSFVLLLSACPGREEAPAPAPTEAPTLQIGVGGPPAGGLGALPGNNTPPSPGQPGNGSPGLGVPIPGGNQPASTPPVIAQPGSGAPGGPATQPGAGSYAAGRPTSK